MLRVTGPQDRATGLALPDILPALTAGPQLENVLFRPTSASEVSYGKFEWKDGAHHRLDRRRRPHGRGKAGPRWLACSSAWPRSRTRRAGRCLDQRGRTVPPNFWKPTF